MCEYCELNKPFEIYGASIHTYIENRGPAVPQLVQTIALDEGVLCNSISINYCPMCGRKLKEADDGNDKV